MPRVVVTLVSLEQLVEKDLFNVALIARDELGAQVFGQLTVVGFHEVRRGRLDHLALDPEIAASLVVHRRSPIPSVLHSRVDHWFITCIV